VVSAFVLEVAKGGPKLEVSTDPAASASSGRGNIEARRISMDRFAEVLARQVNLPVVNHTALGGPFNLEWTPVRLKVTVQAPPDGPSVFTAIQEQLGLKTGDAEDADRDAGDRSRGTARGQSGQKSHSIEENKRRQSCRRLLRQGRCSGAEDGIQVCRVRCLVFLAG
jgi:hypothetical protein